MQIPYLNLSVVNPIQKDELLQAVDRVLSHGRIILGPEVDQLEERVAGLCQKKYAIGVSSGTYALYLALRSLGVGPGDEVITPPLSFIATLNAIVICGATPVFVDVGDDLNMDAGLMSQAITSKTKCIVPVHLTGKLCDMPKIMEIAASRDVYVVEDAAQAFGAHLNGAMAGSFGTVNAFSMNPMKVFSAYGEAGAIVTDDERLYQQLTALRCAGIVNKEEDCHVPSLNGRIDTMQAAMLLVNLQYLEDKAARRHEIARCYSEHLKDAVICPREEEGYSHAYSTFTVLAERRGDLRTYLQSKGIETKIHYPKLMPFHPAYRDRLPTCYLPNAERLVAKNVSIPNHENLTADEVRYIATSIGDFYGV